MSYSQLRQRVPYTMFSLNTASVVLATDEKGVMKLCLMSWWGTCNSRRGIYTVSSRHHSVHTKWQLSLSGVHSIMIDKLAQPSAGEGYSPTPFHYIYHQVQSCSVRS